MFVEAESNDRYYFGPSQFIVKSLDLQSNRKEDSSRRWDFDVDPSPADGRSVRVVHVVWPSEAHRQGMRAGDEILSVNGIVLDRLNKLAQFKDLIDGNDRIRLQIRTVRLFEIDATLYDWFDPRTSRRRSPPPANYLSSDFRAEQSEEEKFIRVDLKRGEKLGLVIRGGTEFGLGIFIASIDRNSVAERRSLKIGDLILSVNLIDFRHRTHQEAVRILKNGETFLFEIRRMNKLPRSKSVTTNGQEERRSENELPRDLIDLLNKYKEQRVNVDQLIDSICSQELAEQKCLVERVRPWIRRFDLDHFDLRFLKEDFRRLSRLHRTSSTDSSRINWPDDPRQRRDKSKSLVTLTTEKKNSSVEQFLQDFNCRIPIRIHKVRRTLGIAIEGGQDDRVPLPRIVYIQPDGSAYLSSELRVGDVLIELDGCRFETLTHRQSALLIASNFKDRSKETMNFLVARSSTEANN